MIRLIINYYQLGNEVRDGELNEALRRNCSNPLIDQILVVGTFDPPVHEKIHRIQGPERPTMSELIGIARERVNDEDITIIANADIAFNETLAKVNKIEANQCYALTRWDEIDGKLIFYSRGDSQDCWIFRGKPPQIDADFWLGRMGCDNALAELLTKCEYIVRNPSYSIIITHIHSSGIRTEHYGDLVRGYRIVHPEHL